MSVCGRCRKDSLKVKYRDLGHGKWMNICEECELTEQKIYKMFDDMFGCADGIEERSHRSYLKETSNDRQD